MSTLIVIFKNQLFKISDEIRSDLNHRHLMFTYLPIAVNKYLTESPNTL